MKSKKVFAIYERKRGSGNVGYRVDLGVVDGKRRFKSFALKEDALAFQRQCIEQQADRKPVVLQELNAATRHNILGAVERLKLHNASLHEAVEFFIKHAKPPKGKITIQELMDEFKKVKTGAGLSKKYLTTSERSFFVPFRKHFKNCNITDVSKDACQKYIYKQKTWNHITIASHIRHLSVLFNFAISTGYATLNPFTTVQRPRRGQSKSADKVMGVEAVRQLLQFALEKKSYKECASLVLVYFCGVRVDEVERITWDHIKLGEENPVVMIEEPKIAHQRRINPIPDNAATWLSLLKNTGKVSPEKYADRMKTLRNQFRRHIAKKAAKANEDAKAKGLSLIDVGKAVKEVDYKQNAARISFASYHIAAFENPSQTSLILGHQSPTLLWNTYRALVTKTQAVKYWKILPNQDPQYDTPIPDAQDARAARLAKAVNG